MTCFISGGAKNGKSTLAQDLTIALSGGRQALLCGHYDFNWSGR